MLLAQAAPNAIACESKQFASGEFFKYGILASVLLMIVAAFAALVLCPLIGMATAG
ncbi:MAG: hypothetical protein ACYTAF_11295 [Planctomycetota bacterium]